MTNYLMRIFTNMHDATGITYITTNITVTNVTHVMLQVHIHWDKLELPPQRPTCTLITRHLEPKHVRGLLKQGGKPSMLQAHSYLHKALCD